MKEKVLELNKLKQILMNILTIEIKLQKSQLEELELINNYDFIPTKIKHNLQQIIENQSKRLSHLSNKAEEISKAFDKKLIEIENKFNS